MFEKFKGTTSLRFYKDLMNAEEVPRNYHSITNKSDQTFYDVFLQDLKKIAVLLTLHKQMRKGSNIAPSEAEEPEQVCRQIDYVLSKLLPKTKSIHVNIADLISEAKSIT